MGAAAPIQFASESSSVRGIAGEYPLDPTTLLRIGRALGRWLTTQHSTSEAAISALFGQDTRITSPMLMQALATGLMAEGINIVNAGVMPLPGVAHLLAAATNGDASGFDIGLYVGAGGDAANHNGFTLLGSDGFPLSTVETSAIEQLIELLRDDRMTRGGAFRRYSLLPASDLIDQYLLHLTGWCAPDALSGWKIVLDCANGAAHKIAPEALKAAGAEIVLTVNDTTDGASINHMSGSYHVLSDPKGMIDMVRAMDADAGISLSGDGDGVVVVTPGGILLDGDVLLAILALEMKSADNLPDDRVGGGGANSRWLEKFLNSHGIELVRSANLLQSMRQHGLRLGGHPDGRIVILDETHVSADGTYVSLLLGWLAAHHRRSGGPTLDDIAGQVTRSGTA